MAGKIYRISGQLQNFYKALFSLLVLIFAVLFFFKLFQEKYEGAVISFVWLFVSVFIFIRMIRTVDLSFDNDHIIIKKGIVKNKRIKYSLNRINEIRTSFEGYFTYITLHDDLGKPLKYSCFNTFTSALKNNKTDVLNINRSLIENSRPESDTVSILKERILKEKSSPD